VTIDRTFSKDQLVLNDLKFKRIQMLNKHYQSISHILSFDLNLNHIKLKQKHRLKEALFTYYPFLIYVGAKKRLKMYFLKQN